MSSNSEITPSEMPAEVELPKELQSSSMMTSAIFSAIDAQRAVAVSYVRGVRRRQMDASPAAILASLELHYVSAVTTSGAAVGATAFIPGAGTAVAIGAGAAEMLLQFELAALFGLSVAEVHGLDLQDRDRARVVILSLMLGREGRSKIAAAARSVMKNDVTAVQGTAASARRLGQSTSLDDLPLADLLGSTLPGDLVPSIVDFAQREAKKRLPEKATKAATRLVPGGVGMILGGIGGFTAGNDVVQAARESFGPVPDALPSWLEPLDTDGDGIPDPTAFEVGMRNAVGTFVQVSKTGASRVSQVAVAVGGGVSGAMSAASRPFRSVDLDGDGVPDEAQALTKAKAVGNAAARAAGAVRGASTSLFTRKRRDAEPTDDSARLPAQEQ